MSGRPAVVDTNVVVAGLLTREAAAPTARILDAMLAGRLAFLLSPALLAEYRRVLLRPAIRTRHGLSEEEVDRILAALAREAAVREPPATAPGPGGAGDAHLWALLAAKPGSILVTGDLALVAARASRGLVTTPAKLVGAWPTDG